MSTERGLMRFARPPSNLVARQDNYKVRKFQMEGDSTLEHQAWIGVVGANGIRLITEIQRYGGQGMEEIVNHHLAQLRKCSGDEEKFAIMQEFYYQLMEEGGNRIKDIVQRSGLAIASEIDNYATYKPADRTFWQRLFGD